MIHLSEIVGQTAVTEPGTKIGEICDIWTEPGERLRVRYLIVLRPGLLTRLGLTSGAAPETSPRRLVRIAWERVVAIEPKERVVVRDRYL